MTPHLTRFYKPALLVLSIVLLCFVSLIQNRLNEERDTMGLTRVEPLENAPPMLAFTTVALGGFRGLIANALWVRVNDLQEQDKYFEMVQLADWITKLQPHFSTVWIHLAWNMSYNISVKFSDHKDRWEWVKRGIELLRDEGLRYNPGEPLLYRELAWHFQHKMGQNLDDAHNYYKEAWFREMDPLFPNGHPDFDELLNPKTEEGKQRVALLRDKFKMDPLWIKEVEDRYGPLEWRLPETHAIYWGYVGLEKTLTEKLKEKEMISLRRVIFQSMQLAFHRGRLVFPRKNSKEFIYAPNLDVVGRTDRAYEEMMEFEPNMLQNIQTAHRNFLKTAVYFLYSYNRLALANQWYTKLRTTYPTALPEGQTLDEFALAKVTEDVGETSHDRVKAILEGLLTSAFMNLAIGEDDLAVSYDRFAKRIWQRFETELPVVSKERVGLPPIGDLKKVVLDQLLDPDVGLEQQVQDQLRTALGLPAATNAVPASATNSVTAPPNSAPVSARP
ncbi:MAG: hypothetical protein O2960_13485 [Verrucomicrobia bacterium]|nr:hypothetical protein [Verrucomicrobiota bacterium]